MAAPRKLFVLRHAKSSWDDPGLDDHERPLAARGRRATKLLATYVRKHEIKPSQVLCSSSRRTRETLEGVAPGGEVLIESGLYDASAEALLQRLRQVPSRAESVMLIGHNPALQSLVLRLAGANGRSSSPEDPDSDLAEVRRKLPTGALVTLSFDCAWSELTPGAATLVDLVRPRDLH
jgi:phosphohistidine phosphatase